MSNIQVQLRRGTTAQHGSFTGAQGELTVDTDKNALVLHDGATAGGVGMTNAEVTAAGSNEARSLADRFADVINLLDYGAVDTPANTSTTFSAAVSAASSNNGAILIPDGTYTINQPIRTTKPIKLLGKSVTIIADSTFTGINFTDGSGTTNLKAILIFNPTNEINTTSGTREFGAFVDDGIFLDCNYNSGTSTAAADYGLFVERMPRSKFMCDVDGANQDGIRINHYCWGVELSNNSVSSSGEAGIVLNKAFNGGVINNPRIFRGDTGVSPKFGIKVSTGTSDNNGITIQGGYIQDMQGTGNNDGHALFFDARCGPVFISGIDIENINVGGSCLYAVGDYASNRVAGPITITGSYLQANTASIIYAEQYYVNVVNCRFREPRLGVSGATNATPIVITSTNHGFSNGDQVTISGVGGNTAANGTFLVAGATSDTFQLTTLAGVDVAGNGEYTSGGTIFAGATYKRFETPGGTDNGIIIAVNNEYETTGETIVDGSNVLVQQRNQATNRTFNYVSTKNIDYSDDYAVYNYAFRDDPSKESGKLRFTNSYQGGTNLRYISKAVLSTSDYKHATGSYGTTSVEVDSVSNSFSPTTDNVHDLGSSSLRWNDVYATNATIQTSDRNQKEQIEELSEQEKTVAVECKSLIRKFKWKDAVLEKGTDARFHFGVVAQDLEKAFSDGGLDARAYGIFIEAKWWEDSEGNRVSEDLEGAIEKSMLGVRYDELLAFIISAM